MVFILLYSLEFSYVKEFFIPYLKIKYFYCSYIWIITNDKGMTVLFPQNAFMWGFRQNWKSYFKCLMTLACLENSPISVGSMVIRGIFLLKIYLWLWMLQKHNNCNISKNYLESSADCVKTLLGRIDFSVLQLWA